MSTGKNTIIKKSDAPFNRGAFLYFSFYIDILLIILSENNKPKIINIAAKTSKIINTFMRKSVDNGKKM